MSIEEVKIGYCIGGVFYIKMAEKALLIKQYYELHNNRRNFLRSIYITDTKKGHSAERSKKEPHRPVINRNNSKARLDLRTQND